MIVCICRGVTDRHLEALVSAGAQTVEQVEKACGAGGDCGACRSEVERIVECGSLCAPPAGGPVLPELVRIRT
jgi:bacterioferritin-associated ferredoxin